MIFGGQHEQPEAVGDRMRSLRRKWVSPRETCNKLRATAPSNISSDRELIERSKP